MARAEVRVEVEHIRIAYLSIFLNSLTEEEQRRQESGLQNDPRGVKGKGEDIIR